MRYRVGPRLLAGSYPHGDAVRELRDEGVTVFLDLTEEGVLPPYAAPELRTIRRPIPDFTCPTDGDMREILDLVDGEVERGETVYVHCQGGIGRTGTVVACHLVRHGMEPEEALATVERLRGWRPETPEQIALIRRWRDVEA